MPTVASGAPDGEDEPVGIVLARMRRAQRLSGAELAQRVGMSQPKISRIERGQGLPDPQDIGHIARVLGASQDQAQALMERAQQTHNRMTDWRPTTTGIAGQQKTIAGWESDATTVRACELMLIPGLLQTSGYAKLLMQVSQPLIPLSAVNRTESALLNAVSERIKRQEILADPAKSFQFILGEAALRRRIIPAAEMLAQLGSLRETIARRPNVKIAAVPDGAPTAVPLLHSFQLLDDQLVVVDLYNTGLTSRSKQDIETYRRVFDLIEEQAVDIEPLLDKYQALYVETLQSGRTTTT